MTKEIVKLNKVGKYRDKERKYKLNANAKFDWKWVHFAERALAHGMTIQDIGLFLGITEKTFDNWKKQIPEFKEACERGRELSKTHLVAQMARAAMGYDYITNKKKYKMVQDEKKPNKLKKIQIEEEKITHHQKAEPTLLMFLACNLMPEFFKNTQHIETTQRTDRKFIENETEEHLNRFVGKLADKLETKKVESTVVKTD